MGSTEIASELDGILSPSLGAEAVQHDGFPSASLPFRPVEPVEICVKNLSASVGIAPPTWRTVPVELFKSLRRKKKCIKNQKKTILQEVSAFMPKGSLTAIIGSSGSGKTSLLNVMAGRTASWKVQVEGLITFNGRRSMDEVRSAYVKQEDVLIPTLTVRETFQYAADLCLPPPTNEKERHIIVEQVIDELGLRQCADTRVGNGCSGGQRRRTSIGIQMLANSPVLLCDEPTTGLDAASAFQIVSSMTKLAQSGRTVIISIHAPRPEIWNLFDQVVLLSCGSVLYAGPADESTEYFEGLRFTLPPFANTAEFLVDLTAIDTRTPELEACSKERIDSLKKAWRSRGLETGHSQKTSVSRHRERGFPVSEIGHVRSPSFTWQLRVLAARTFKTTLRDPSGVAGSLVRAIGMAILNGWIFLNVGESLSGIRSRQGSLYVAGNLNGYIVLLYEAFRLSDDIRLFDREREDELVGVSAFMLSRTAARLFLEDLPAPLIFSIIFYFMVGYRPNAGQFFIFTMFSVLTHYTAISFAAVCIGITRSFPAASLACNISFALQSFTCGYFIQSQQIPVYVQWLKWASYMFYIFSGLCANEFAGHFYGCPYSNNPTDPACKEYTGNSIMQNLGFPSNWIYRPILILVAFIVGFYILAGLLLQYNLVSTGVAKARKADRTTALSDGTRSNSTHSALGKHRVLITLQNYNLEIKERKWLGIKSNSLQILKPMTAEFKPGQLNVIMGSSGSGKTSLLKSMAGRLHDSLSVQYRQHGAMLYNGAVPSTGVIRSATSLVTQDENGLIPVLTLRETLQFAAELRLPAWMSRTEKLRRSEEVILMMGLKDCADNVIGSNDTEGISGGEKRRVMIAVQLLTNPRILLLDEPTSGLDVFTAELIIELLSRLTADGRTIIISVHQSRASVVRHFSNILLLATGGHQVYSGEGKGMIPYFGSLGYNCLQTTNPTDFVLDLINDDHDNRVKRLAATWGQQVRTQRHESVQIAAPAQVGTIQREMNPFHITFPLVLRRSIVNLWRNPRWLLARSSQVIGMSITIVLFYAPLKHDYEAVQSRMGFIQEFAAFYFVGLFQNLAIYVSERDIFYFEEADSCYSVETFLLQYTLLELPFEVLPSILFGLFAAFVCDLERTVKVFLICAVNCTLILNCGESIGIMISTVFSHIGFAVNVVSIMLSISTVMGGIMSLNVNSFLDALNHLSPVKYLIANLASYTIRGQKVTCTEAQRLPNGHCPIENGIQVLQLYNLDNNAGLNLMALGICTVAYRLVAYALLKLRQTHVIEKVHGIKLWLQGGQ